MTANDTVIGIEITQTDLHSPPRAECWILIQHWKAIIKAAQHERGAPSLLLWHVRKCTQMHTKPPPTKTHWIHTLQKMHRKYFIFILLQVFKSRIRIRGSFTSNKNGSHPSIYLASEAERFNRYSQQIIEWDTFNPLIWQVHSTFHSTNAPNPGKNYKTNMGTGKTIMVTGCRFVTLPQTWKTFVIFSILWRICHFLA